jgi:GcrA cell cycle regulator
MWRWNTERTDVVRELYPTHSASIVALRIAEKFGEACTRNSVMGIVYRLKLQKGGMGHHPPHELKRPMVATMKFKPKPKPEWKPQPEYSGPRVSGIQCPCQVVDLERYNCHWPIGDPKQSSFYFCGAVVMPDQPYCPTHLKFAYSHLPADGFIAVGGVSP